MHAHQPHKVYFILNKSSTFCAFVVQISCTTHSCAALEIILIILWCLIHYTCRNDSDGNSTETIVSNPCNNYTWSHQRYTLWVAACVKMHVCAVLACAYVEIQTWYVCDKFVCFRAGQFPGHSLGMHSLGMALISWNGVQMAGWEAI